MPKQIFNGGSKKDEKRLTKAQRRWRRSIQSTPEETFSGKKAETWGY